MSQQRSSELERGTPVSCLEQEAVPGSWQGFVPLIIKFWTPELSAGTVRGRPVRAQAGAPHPTGNWLGRVPGSQAALETEGPGAARFVGSVATPPWEWGEDGIWEAALGGAPAS